MRSWLSFKGEEKAMAMTEFQKEQVVERLKDVRSRLIPCRPPLWAMGGHAQTVLGHILPSPTLKEKGETINVTLEREDERIVTTYLKGRSHVVVYLFHGLVGHSEADYMRRTAMVARSLGHHVFMNNHRGCGKGVGLAVEPYHSGRSEDLATVIAYGRKMLPDHRHIAVGFSLSANALLLLAARIRADTLPDAAIAVNAPINLDRASTQLDKGLNLVYNYRFVGDLKKAIEQRQQTGRLRSRYRLEKVRTVRQFDEAYTAPAGGFKNRDDYYSSCSAQRYLPRVIIPTVLLTAADDPFVDVADYKSVEVSDTVVTHIEPHGGHMGYLSREKTPLDTHRWLDYALKEYIAALS